jgi:pre-mRNA-splicing helicase BRR2
MGSRARRAAPKDVEHKKKKAAEDGVEKSSKKRTAAATGFGYADILEATQDVEGIRYQPRTAETRTVYELMLGMVHRALGDQAQDVVRSAADTILETLKTEGLKDFDKKKEVEEILGSMSSEDFSQLLNLSKKITDYVAEDEEMRDPDEERKEGALDDTAGVAVVWDEAEEEEEDYEIRDDSEASEEEEENLENQPPVEDEAGEESLVFGGGGTKTQKREKVDSDRVSPHDIDGFWLQRLLAGVYDDPTTATEKTTEALSILSSDSSVRDVENALMDLLNYEHHDIVRLLVKNRDVVVWCTKLARSDDQERMNVEVAMRERNVGWILKELRGDRTKRQAADADTMDVDMQEAVPKTATIAPGSLLAPKRILDLESMAFAQGGHLMSNKKTTLPPGTVKRTKKGYEEIHVPYKPIPPLKVDDRVPVATMPAWTQEAFPKVVTHLNRVQSKLYPIAFGTDEPILLCAPTGAGKVSFN